MPVEKAENTRYMSYRYQTKADRDEKYEELRSVIKNTSGALIIRNYTDGEESYLIIKSEQIPDQQLQSILSARGVEARLPEGLLRAITRK